MEPFSAITLLAAKHGVAMVLGALGGDDKLAGAAGELFAALTASENAIDQRLAGIEAQLAHVIDQQYTIALQNGTRYLFEAGLTGDPDRRAADLELARQQFIHARSAAKDSPLQRATAGRYLLLVSIATDRVAAAAASLPEVEAALLDAALIAKVNWLEPEREARRIARAQGGLYGRDARLDAARREVSTTGQQSMLFIGRMLAELALMAPALGLPARLMTPGAGPSSQAVAVRWDLEVPHDGGRFAGVGCWFDFKGWPNRVGPLKMYSYPISAELTFDPPLRHPVNVQVRMAKGPHRDLPAAAGTSRVTVAFDGYTDQLTERAQRIDICPSDLANFGVFTFAPQGFLPWHPGMWQTGS